MEQAQKTPVPIEPAEEETDCLDGFLWIGQSYPDYHSFVEEAERRGISRRISHTAPWAIPGRTRIFLAHWDGETDASKGRIFGYFVLGRTEVLAFPEETAPPKPGGDGKHGPEVRTQRCWDGEEIVTHRWNRARKRWERTRQRCPEFPEPECEDEDFLYARSEDGEWIATHACIDGRWQPTGSWALEYVPIDHEVFVPRRGCGFREDPGSVYLVDGLAAEIGDAFTERLLDDPLYQPLDEVDPKHLDPLIQEAAHEAFEKVVDEVTRERGARARVPGALQDKATVHGDLVLFDDPPLFEKHPQAWFRPLEHIDGDDLFERIAAGEPKVPVHGYHHRRAGALSQQEVVSVLAERMEANKAFTERLLTELGDLAQEELKAHKKFRIPGLGMLKDEDGQLRLEVY